MKIGTIDIETTNNGFIVTITLPEEKPETYVAKTATEVSGLVLDMIQANAQALR